MKTTLLTVASCFLLSFVPTFFSGDIAWDISLYVRDMQLSLFIVLVLHKTNKCDIMQRTLCSVFLAYTVIEAHLYLLNSFFDYSIYEAVYYSLISVTAIIYLKIFPEKYCYG